MKSTTALSGRSPYAILAGMMGFQPMTQPDLFTITVEPQPTKPAPQKSTEEEDIPFRRRHRRGRDGEPLYGG